MRDHFWMAKPNKEGPPTKPEEGPPQEVPVIFLGGEDSISEDTVEVAQNRIFFYADVSRMEILKLNKHLDSLEKKVLTNAILLGGEPSNIYLHVNSFGGSLFAGLAAVDYIRKCKVPVHTIIDGCAASAATLLTVVGAHRQIHRHSFMLIHQLSTMMWGKYEELKDDMKNNDLLMKTIKDIYVEHTKIPKRQLNKVLKHDLWWDAETCLKYGLVDEII
jgi:ATP-dependent Clp endopeptidase proteolytic subunit ClpP